ncbi:MAG: hypothetical protein DMG57_43430 [Acidobacteria bacterium]|nr:MAG: hypothetical protein DMG57_43430 [Acidobacteriota bacterium]
MPCRLVDTRNVAGPLGGPGLLANQTRAFPLLTGQCGLPVAARSYSLNVTVVPKGPVGFLTMWPTGVIQPVVATVNDVTGTIVGNAAIVPSGTNGSVNVFVTDATDVVVDVNGYFAAPGSGGEFFFPVTPCRVEDTRLPNGSPPLNGMLQIDVAASGCGIPAEARAYVFSATVVPQGPLGYLHALAHRPDTNGGNAQRRRWDHHVEFRHRAVQQWIDQRFRDQPDASDPGH